MNYLLAGVGGIFGSLTRFILGRKISQKKGGSFPSGTFVINVTGAFLLGVVSGLELPESGYILIGDGFLGGYTTFSTFMYEGFDLISGKEKLNASIYIFGSLFLGIIFYMAGFFAAKQF
ncbi:MAG: fluoride efflux transporter CrcB [Eubacteriaceae bacterium]|nr:fluoride efflux transporter CrcB [Eubacteriaceae bacterium]